MHPFFEVLQAALVARPTGSVAGRIHFRILGIEEEGVLVDLGRRTTRAQPLDPTAELTIFCDRTQLDAMLESGFTARPLRYVGDRTLLDDLGALMQPAKSPLSVRFDGEDR